MKNRRTLGIASLSLGVALLASAALKGETVAAVPEKLRIPDGQKPSLEVKASGVQIYKATYAFSVAKP